MCRFQEDMDLITSSKETSADHTPHPQLGSEGGTGGSELSKAEKVLTIMMKVPRNSDMVSLAKLLFKASLCLKPLPGSAVLAGMVGLLLW